MTQAIPAQGGCGRESEPMSSCRGSQAVPKRSHHRALGAIGSRVFSHGLKIRVRFPRDANSVFVYMLGKAVTLAHFEERNEADNRRSVLCSGNPTPIRAFLVRENNGFPAPGFLFGGPALDGAPPFIQKTMISGFLFGGPALDGARAQLRHGLDARAD